MAKKKPRVSAGNWNIILIVLAVVGTAALVWFLLGNEQFRALVEFMVEYTEEHPLLSGAVYVLIQASTVIFLLPGLLTTLLAGYLFGPVFGTCIMVCGTVLGASTAFLAGRFVLSARVERYLARHQRMEVLARSIAHDGWKTVMLIRTIPLFPFKVSNYCFGVLPISLGAFTFGTMLGVIPLTVTNVSIGAFAGDLETLMDGSSRLHPSQYAVIALGIGCGLATFLLVRKRAAEYFAKAEQQAAGNPGAGESESGSTPEEQHGKQNWPLRHSRAGDS